MTPPKCCGTCDNWICLDVGAGSDELAGVCVPHETMMRHNSWYGCAWFRPRPFIVAADVPRLVWKRDNEGVWFVRDGDVELTVKHNLDVERWEWCAGMAVDEWVECERGLRRTRAKAMRAAEAHVGVVRKVMKP